MGTFEPKRFPIIAEWGTLPYRELKVFDGSSITGWSVLRFYVSDKEATYDPYGGQIPFLYYSFRRGK
jgi:hypothetical protein